LPHGSRRGGALEGTVLEPKWDLPPGVYVDTDRDARTVDVLNRSDAAVVAHVADVMRSFGVTVGEEEGTVRLEPGERFTFYRGAARGDGFGIDVTCYCRNR
jgi:hypothetical protein